MHPFHKIMIAIALVAACNFPHAVAAAAPAEVPVAPAAEAPAASPLPEAIQHLAPLYDKQDEFVAALRAWSKIQIAAIGMGMDEAKALARERKQAEANTKRDSAKDTLKAVRGAYEFALKKYAQDAKLVNAYGELLYDQFGDNPGALKAWNNAIELDSKYAPPYNNLGLDQCHTGSYALGIKNLERALELDKKNPDFMFNIAQIYLIHFPEVEKAKGWSPKKIYDRAMKLSAEATKIDPTDYQLAEDYAVNFFAAENFKVEADWEKAAKAWQQARTLATRPDRVFFTWLNEGRCWLREGNNPQAKTCLEEALKLVPDSGPAKQLLEQASAAPSDKKAKKKR